MSKARVYLDHNATSPLRPEARDAMTAAMHVAGNPSSVHAEGRAARAIVEQAREDIAAAFGIATRNVTFTSGGTEAANASLFAAAKTLGVNRDFSPVVVAATEHPCILKAMAGVTDVHIVAVDANGIVDLGALREGLRESSPAVIAIQDVNSETGVQSANDHTIDELRRESGSILICDMVQSAGRSEFKGLRSDVALVSAHKFGGPKGVGAILWRDSTKPRVAPLLLGGGQEGGRRAGTENVIGIAGMAAALKAAQVQAEAFGTWAVLAQAALEAGLKDTAADVVIFGEAVARAPYTTCFAVPGITAELALMALDLDGIAVSSGSACSSGKVATSHVLKAMSVPDDLARCAIRVSTGWTSTDGDIARFLESFTKLVRHRRMPRAA